VLKKYVNDPASDEFCVPDTSGTRTANRPTSVGPVDLRSKLRYTQSLVTLNRSASSADGDRLGAVIWEVDVVAGDAPAGVVKCAPRSGGAGTAAPATFAGGDVRVVVTPSPLFDREAKYGTPIEAPTSEAMMSGLEAMVTVDSPRLCRGFQFRVGRVVPINPRQSQGLLTFCGVRRNHLRHHRAGGAASR
jgi:hypothetical protein